MIRHGPGPTVPARIVVPLGRVQTSQYPKTLLTTVQIAYSGKFLTAIGDDDRGHRRGDADQGLRRHPGRRVEGGVEPPADLFRKPERLGPLPTAATA